MSSKKRSRSSTPLPQHTPKTVIAFHAIALLAVIVTPLLISPSFVELFEFPKTIFIYTLTIAAMVITAIWWYQRGAISIIRTVADAPLALFLVLLSIATVLSIDHYVSIVGYYSRFNGSWLSYVCCFMLFWVVLVDTTALQADDTGQAKRRRQLLWGWVLSMGVVALMAVLNYVNHDPLCLLINQSFSNSCWTSYGDKRIFATLGQPNTLASYLLSGLPLAITLLLTTTKQIYRWGLFIIIGLASLALLYTLSRSGWIGFGVELVILAIFLSKEMLKTRRWWLTGLMAMWIAIVLLNVNIFSQRVSQTVSPQDLAASTTTTRLLVWQGAEQIVEHHPWIGTGPETFIYSFLPYRSRALNDTVEWNTVYDKAHNEILQIATGMGVPAALAWLALFGSPLLVILYYRQQLLTGRWYSQLVQRLRFPSPLQLPITAWPSYLWPMAKADEAVLSPLLLGSLVASMVGVIVSLLFAFSTITLNVLLFMALALLLAPSAKVRVRICPKPAMRGLIGAGGLVVVVLIFMLGRYTIADWHIQAGQNAVGRGDMQQATNDFQLAIGGNPYERVYRLAYSYMLALNGTSQSGKRQQELFAQADHQTQQALNQGPLGDVVLVRAIDTYTYLANQNADYAPVLGKLVGRGEALIPTSANMASFAARYFLQFGSQDVAKTAVDHLMELRPKAAASYVQRAAWYVKYRQPELARQDLVEAKKLGIAPSDPLYLQIDQQLKQSEPPS